MWKETVAEKRSVASSLSLVVSLAFRDEDAREKGTRPFSELGRETNTTLQVFYSDNNNMVECVCSSELFTIYVGSHVSVSTRGPFHQYRPQC